MARIKISEYIAKNIVCPALDIPWKGMKADKNTSVKSVQKLFQTASLTVKVDQGIKKRGKLGLLKVGVDAEEAINFVRLPRPFGPRNDRGYSQFLIEEVVAHKPEEEHYLSIERVREGMRVLYSNKGGIEIEDHLDNIVEFTVLYHQITNNKLQITNKLQISNKPLPTSPNRGGQSTDWGGVLSELVTKLIEIMNQNHFSFLEINPLVIQGEKVSILDLVVEADDATSTVERIEELNTHPAEIAVAKLQENTPASLKLKIINPNGRIWMLLSGGGASLVLSDEVADRGYGTELGNYGEYSGSPSTEDTYLYTKILLDTMLSSPADNKVLIIAGGVANFTDVVKTFKGVISALDEYKSELLKQGIKVFVRRGGPNQEKGLRQMKEFLEKNGLYGSVSGPEEELTRVIGKAIII